ncbi:MAG TPA: helical backbone metal receptor [Bacteroidia bacterium]|nr:helical backbone metal receptor [Bacteroidia bacterium]
MEFKDQLNRNIKLNTTPTRIVSLVPSQTELLFQLGLEDEVKGITKFCIHPIEWQLSKTIVGGTKNINIEKIRSLSPDLIIANKEENDREQIDLLSKEYPIWISDIHDLQDSLEMIEALGNVTGKQKPAQEICHLINNNFERLQKYQSDKSQTVIYLIWRNPFLSVGRDTFIHDMLCKCGFTNLTGDELRYPEISKDKFKSLDPDIIFLSSEPYPFSLKHVPEISSLCPKADIHIVDGEMFSWYGSHLIKAPEYFHSIIQEVNSAS